MTRFELQDRMKGRPEIAAEDYAVLEKLYILLDLDKNIFAKIVDAAGVDTLVGREQYWDRLQAADDERQLRLKYERVVQELAEVNERQSQLQDFVDNYKGAKR